jgi:S-adenosylmethionine synthetase
MFGYATTETPQLMPMAIWTAHRLAERLTDARRSGALGFLRPDGKTRSPSATTARCRAPSTRWSSRRSTIPTSRSGAPRCRAGRGHRPGARRRRGSTSNVRYVINPAGPFVTGGPKGDAGSRVARSSSTRTVGRRATAAALQRQGPSKVDRSAAYAMRWVAKNAVAAGLAERLEVQVAYAIGRAEPVGLYVETFGTGPRLRRADHHGDPRRVRPAPAGDHRPARPAAPDLRADGGYGHFGRELPEFTWERTDRVDELRAQRSLTSPGPCRSSRAC